MNGNKFTFEELLEAIPSIQNDLREIKNLLNCKPDFDVPDQLLNIEEAGSLLNLSVATLYTKVQKAEIPNCKRGGRLYFSKHDLVEWVKAGRRKTHSEIEELADKILKEKKGPYHD